MTVPVITDAIVGAVAKAIAASATDRASKGSARWLKVRLGRTDEDRALRAALSSAFGSFRVSHRDWSQTFFDAHFLQHSAAPFLAQAVDPTTFPAAAELADAWERQFGAKQSPIRPDLLEACEAFLGSFRLAIRRSPAFQSLYDSEATDTILEEVRALKAAVDVAQMHREGTDRVARSIAAAYAGFDKVVTRLTDEQCRVIDLLRHYKRALVYGVAGSGKTLVAAEKAIRVARADRETLFICHNPNLAAWVRTLVQDSPVIVATVDEFVAGALGRPSPPLADWSPYSSPYNEDLDEAFDRISETGPYFDAVIVDEGQDFDETWWIVIEAAMRSDDAEFYVFYDESQALLPGRGRYPISGPPFDLSRNCRNAGRVYEMMRIIEPAAPEPDAALTGLGDAMCFAGTTDLASAIRAGVKWLLGAGALSDCVVLLGGGVPFEQSVLADLRFHPLPPLDWGDAIRRAFRQLQALISSHLAQQRALHPDRDPARSTTLVVYLRKSGAIAGQRKKTCDSFVERRISAPAI
jgi:hypothetical protein